MYNVLWIDDEYEKGSRFMKNCEEFHDIHLEPFRTRKLGMVALEKDLYKWDAVLLDGKMLDEDENEVPRLDGLRKAKERLDELRQKMYIPYFVSTGQPDLMSNEMFQQAFGDYYVKGKDDLRLIEDMKREMEKSDYSQIKVYYNEVFSAIKTLEVVSTIEPILLDIFLPMHYPAKDPNFRPVHHYNQLRQALEYLFRACNKVGLIPDQCVKGTNINLNQCSLYLAGKNATIAGVKYNGPNGRIVPDYIENFIRSILEFGNIHSHTVELTEEDKLKIDAIFRSKRSRFIIFSLTMQMCEVITWLSEYISNNNDKEKNLQYCIAIPPDASSFEGERMMLEKDDNGNYHCGDFSIFKGVAEKFKVGEMVEIFNVETKGYNGYLYSAKIRKIN